jgi:diguanylate cyclase (GGDEF)-like protein/PAS domain S-box-containing protein
MSGMTRGRSSLEDAETLREFVRRLSEGIYITTREGRILDANPALLSILGIADLADPVALDVRRLWVDPAERQRQTDLLAANGTVREFELDLRRPDGEIRTVLDTCYQVTDPDSGEPLYHGILVDITPRKELERQLLESSRRDALTGCLNRRFLDEYTARYEPGATAWGAVVVDVDGFKAYNDRLGHEVGDRVLRDVAAFLEEQVRGEDHVVRLGGDEFLVLLTGRGACGVDEVAQRIAAAPGLEVRLSVGWAIRRTHENLDQTIARADQDLIARRASRRGAESRPRID